MSSLKVFVKRIMLKNKKPTFMLLKMILKLEQIPVEFPQKKSLQKQAKQRRKKHGLHAHSSRLPEVLRLHVLHCVVVRLSLE